MRRVALGRGAVVPGLAVPELGFGCEQLGGFGWGNVSRDEVLAAIDTAFEHGITFFDTADVYGMGESERRLGEALEGRHEDAFVSTKFGVRLDADRKAFYDCSPEWLREALPASLRRLRRERIDLYWVHYWDQRTPWESLFEALEAEVSKGTIAAFGLSNMTPETLPKTLPPHCVAVQFEYSLARRDAERLLSATKALALTPVAYGCLGQGILTGKYATSETLDSGDRRASVKYRNFHGARLEANLAIVETMRKIAARTGLTLPQIAVRWVLDRLEGGIALSGIKRPEQLLSLVPVLTAKLSPEDHAELERISSSAQ